MLKGWKYVAFIGVIVGGIGATLYPIIIHPMINTEEYSKIDFSHINIILTFYFQWFIEKIQKATRAGINQQEVQPGSKIIFKLSYFEMNLINNFDWLYRYESVVRSIRQN